MTAPVCLNCGKRLRKKTQSVKVPIGAAAPVELNGAPVLKVTKRETWNGMDSLRVWCGRWGAYGDNYFCGLACAQCWAAVFVGAFESTDPELVEKWRDRAREYRQRKNNPEVEP